MGRARILANLEISWWKAHHRKKRSAMLEAMAGLYSELHGIAVPEAKEVVAHRVEAAVLHDVAERLEDDGHAESSEVYWTKAEEKLEEHFALLLTTIEDAA